VYKYVPISQEKRGVCFGVTLEISFWIKLERKAFSVFSWLGFWRLIQRGLEARVVMLLACWASPNFVPVLGAHNAPIGLLVWARTGPRVHVEIVDFVKAINGKAPCIDLMMFSFV
jgi:hypothetical protein